ncbi:MAG: hypothetical protein KC503_16430 [Myxococcales bacterium]|nr:hypothetical protein [Myxococcales bacterium]
MAGISPEQGPPLWGPMAFFCTAPLFVVAAGLALAPDPNALSARWWPQALLATHLGTLGFAGSVMLGALYQMLPVVASSPVPAPRLSHVVNAALLAGTAALAWGLARHERAALLVGGALLALAFVLFVVPIAWALWRAPARTATVIGMRISLMGLAVVVTLGILMTLGRAGVGTSFGARSLFYLHVTFGGALWIGGLIAAVSWQVLPMFYLCEEASTATRVTTLAGLVLSGIALGALLLANVATAWVYAVAAAPAMLAVWLVHPLSSLRALRRRRRRRADESLRFWMLGLCCGPLCLVAAVASAISEDPRWPVLLGFTALWGWAGLIMHGMLTRIVPFLVWFHRYASLVGKQPVPAMKQLLPARHVRVALVAHGVSLLAGWVAIAASTHVSPWLSGAFGAALVVTGGALASEIARVVRHVGREPCDSASHEARAGQTRG